MTTVCDFHIRCRGQTDWTIQSFKNFLHCALQIIIFFLQRLHFLFHLFHRHVILTICTRGYHVECLQCSALQDIQKILIKYSNQTLSLWKVGHWFKVHKYSFFYIPTSIGPPVKNKRGIHIWSSNFICKQDENQKNWIWNRNLWKGRVHVLRSKPQLALPHAFSLKMHDHGCQFLHVEFYRRFFAKVRINRLSSNLDILLFDWNSIEIFLTRRWHALRGIKFEFGPWCQTPKLFCVLREWQPLENL